MPKTVTHNSPLLDTWFLNSYVTSQSILIDPQQSILHSIWRRGNAAAADNEIHPPTLRPNPVRCTTPTETASTIPPSIWLGIPTTTAVGSSNASAVPSVASSVSYRIWLAWRISSVVREASVGTAVRNRFAVTEERHRPPLKMPPCPSRSPCRICSRRETACAW